MRQQFVIYLISLQSIQREEDELRTFSQGERESLRERNRGRVRQVFPLSIHSPYVNPIYVKFTLASPNTIYVSKFGLLNTSGCEITNIIFRDFLMVTFVIPGKCFSPSFNIALRAFFSLLLCFPWPTRL